MKAHAIRCRKFGEDIVVIQSHRVIARSSRLVLMSEL